jgi:NAD(P)-dependent dehydrogenase (short-subunit alcohol dehydrogenase family)
MALLGRLTGPKMLRDPRKLAEAVGGKVVVITGASTGLGAALAKHCGAAGAIVVICARSTDLLNAVAEEIRADGGRVHAYTVDLADDSQVMNFAAGVLRDHGRVDVLVHNAGKSLNRPVSQSYRRPKDLFATNSVNYLGPVRLTMAWLPYMRARGSGHIVNISSGGVMFFPAPRWSFYLASKAAFDWWLRAVAYEIKVDGVDTTHYYLGSVRTRMSASNDLLHRTPSQSADEAAWGVARAMVYRPRSMAWRPIYVVNVLTTALRGPVGRWCETSVVRMPESDLSASRALPEEDFVFGDPNAL